MFKDDWSSIIKEAVSLQSMCATNSTKVEMLYIFKSCIFFITNLYNKNNLTFSDTGLDGPVKTKELSKYTMDKIVHPEQDWDEPVFNKQSAWWEESKCWSNLIINRGNTSLLIISLHLVLHAKTFLPCCIYEWWPLWLFSECTCMMSPGAMEVRSSCRVSFRFSSIWSVERKEYI